MLTVTKTDINNAGGMLAALNDKAVGYLRSLLTGGNVPIPPNSVKRHIVHTDPHLDEYFAELLFAACSPTGTDHVEFVEEAIFAEDNDLGAQQLWPEAVVFGIGRTVSSDIEPLLLFDEHLAGQGKTSPSCSYIVYKYLASQCHVGFPSSIMALLREINAIDAYGNADAQHLANTVKLIHNVRFLFSKGNTPADDVKDFLDPLWKRVIVICCVTAVVYALENGIDLLSDPDAKKKAIQKSLNHYLANTPHRQHSRFNDAFHGITSLFGNQEGAFRRAILFGSNGRPIVDKSRANIPQLLLLSRICFASDHCWGTEISQVIMMHLWESEFQKQLNFLTVSEELKTAVGSGKRKEVRTSVGTIRYDILGSIDAEKKIYDPQSRSNRLQKCRLPLWIIGIKPSADVFSVHQAALNYINKHNQECGLLLVENSFLGTKVIFRGDSIPDQKWKRLVDELKAVEPDCWYDVSTDPNRPAKFLNNGNKAHQYVQRSGLDFDALKQLASGLL